MKAAEWIDRVKTSKGIPSDYAVAKAIGLSRSAVSVYRKKPDATLDESTALMVAQTLTIDPAYVLADQAMERARNDQAKASWKRVLATLVGKEKAPTGGASGVLAVTDIIAKRRHPPKRGSGLELGAIWRSFLPSAPLAMIW